MNDFTGEVRPYKGKIKEKIGKMSGYYINLGGSN